MAEKREADLIEVDVDQPAPLSKKQKRLEKKGKLEPKEPKQPVKSERRSPWAVWVGNLPFDIDEPALTHFITQSAEDLEADAITRINLVPKKGFAYVDLATQAQMEAVIKLSEKNLGGRRLLIKNAKSFEGRPVKEESIQPPSRILFVGNLSYETTDEHLEMHFQHCGEIRKIRTATFQDTGKCKGFTFIDFVEEASATNALRDRQCRVLHGRTLRMEYGEDRSKRNPRHLERKNELKPESVDVTVPVSDSEVASQPPLPTKQFKDKGVKRTTKRPTPGAALANAARGRTSMPQFEGKKILFD